MQYLLKWLKSSVWALKPSMPRAITSSRRPPLWGFSQKLESKSKEASATLKAWKSLSLQTCFSTLEESKMPKSLMQPMLLWRSNWRKSAASKSNLCRNLPRLAHTTNFTSIQGSRKKMSCTPSLATNLIRTQSSRQWWPRCRQLTRRRFRQSWTKLQVLLEDSQQLTQKIHSMQH